MTATERLRALLDERGVKWWPLGSDMTECFVDDVRIKYRQVGRGLIVSTCIVLTCTEGTVTPEQAVAATLGRGTCHLTREPGSDRLWYCDHCGSYHEHPSDYAWEFCPRCGARVVKE